MDRNWYFFLCLGCCLELRSPLISQLNRYVSTQRALERAYDDRTEDYCWRGPRRFRFIADAERYFKISLQLRFANGAALMTLPPLNYLIISVYLAPLIFLLNRLEIWKDDSLVSVLFFLLQDKGNACLGILNGTKDGLDKDVTLIGGKLLLVWQHLQENLNKKIKVGVGRRWFWSDEPSPTSSINCWTIAGLSMLNRLVIYDNEKQRIGWANTDYCSVWKWNEDRIEHPSSQMFTYMHKNLNLEWNLSGSTISWYNKYASKFSSVEVWVFCFCAIYVYINYTAVHVGAPICANVH